MKNVERAARTLMRHWAGEGVPDDETTCCAEALKEAGLLMPDLPEPDEEGRFWVGDRPLWISWNGQPCIEARGLGGFAVLEGATVPLGEAGEARAVALALFAADELEAE